MRAFKSFWVIFFVFGFLGFMVFLEGCRKDFPRKAALTTVAMDKPSAMATGKIIDLGGKAVLDHGFCWDNAGFPSVDGNNLLLGNINKTGEFTGKIPALMPKMVYYLKAFMRSEDGVVYGELLSFTTPDLPSVATDSVANISETTAVFSGNISSDGGSPITGRGICWAVTSDPDTNGLNFKDTIRTTGTFSFHASGLTGGKQYFARAYSMNLYGIRYGNEVTFATTQPATLAVVTTGDVSSIFINQAIAGGEVISDGGSAVTGRGVCWSTNPTPTISDSKTIDGSGLGSFISALTGLNPGTKYYVRAYATNGVGTAYGTDLSFFTQEFVCGQSFQINHVVGPVNPVSKTVFYGTVTNIPGEPSKCWITSNLGSDHQATAVNDATEESAGWYWQFNRKQGYKHDGTNRTPNTTWISSFNENSEWIADNDPCGLQLGSTWHIPTYTEWRNVDNTGGWTNWTGWWNSDLKLHAAGRLWHNYGGLSGRGEDGYYWSRTQTGQTHGYYLLFNINQSFVGDMDEKADGYTLRCIR